MTQPSNMVNSYVNQFQSFEKLLNGESALPIHSIRKNAIKRFADLGFPTTNDEEWRFTNLTPLATVEFTPSFQCKPQSISNNHFNKNIIQGISTTRLAFIDGKFSKEFSSVKPQTQGIIIGQLWDALHSEQDIIERHLTRYAHYHKNSFTALNTGFMKDGAFIIVPDNMVVEDPVYLVFFSTGGEKQLMSHPRNLIIVGKHSQVTVVEHYIHLNTNAYFTNTVTEIALDEHAMATHIKLQHESMKAFHVGSLDIHQNFGSKFTSNSIMIGGSLVRNNISSVLNGEGIECTINGLSLGAGQQLIDNHTAIDHAKPHCDSHELFKAIHDGKSKGVFNGKIYVRRDAQKTDAKQTNKTLLLSDEATMNTKPQLEIFADDVKCTHGATIGYLDAESIFYLRSRGIGEDIARDLLTYAFANDVIDRISIEPIRRYLNHILYARLKQGRQLENL